MYVYMCNKDVNNKTTRRVAMAESSAGTLLHLAAGTENVAEIAKYLRNTVYHAVTPGWWMRAAAEMRTALLSRYSIRPRTSKQFNTPHLVLCDIHTNVCYVGFDLYLSTQSTLFSVLGQTMLVDYVVAMAGVMLDHINNQTRLHQPGDDLQVVRGFAYAVQRMFNIFACMVHERAVILAFHEDSTSELAVTFDAGYNIPTVSLNTAHLVPRAQGYRVGTATTHSLLEYIMLLISYTNEHTSTRIVHPGYVDENPHGIDLVSVRLLQRFESRLRELVHWMHTALVVPWSWYAETDPRIVVTSDGIVTVTHVASGSSLSLVPHGGGDTVVDRLTVLAGISLVLRGAREPNPGRVAAAVFRGIFHHIARIFEMPEAARVVDEEIDDFDVELECHDSKGVTAFVARKFAHDGSPLRCVRFRFFLKDIKTDWRQLHSSLGIPSTPEMFIAETLWHEAIHMCLARPRSEDAHGDAFHAFAARQGVRFIWREGTAHPVGYSAYPGIAYYTTSRASAM